MKKFTAVVESIREINEKELSELQKSYREYFGAKMEKFGVKSPAELDDAQKKEFFNEITKDWEKGQGASEAGKKDVEEHGVKESEDVNEKEIKTAEEFKAFAEDKLKKQHGDDFDQDKADKVIKGLSDEAEKSDDWGAAVGKLNKA
jgi:hypothetical protein